MQTSQGSLTIINAHTADPQVFWNGTPVTGFTSISVDSDTQKVVIKVPEDAVLAEMQAAGIIVRRV